MKNLTFLMFILVSFFACQSKEELNPANQVVPVKENLGVRTLSWLSPYVGKTSVTFEDSVGNKQIFDVSKSETTIETYTSTKIIEGESFTLSLTNRLDASVLFSFKPVGKNLIWFGNTPEVNEASNLLRIVFGPFTSEREYGASYSSGVNNLNADFLEYKYGPNYPEEGGDSFVFKAETRLKLFYTFISIAQGKGIEYYVDSKGVKWKQTLIQ